MNKSKIFFVLSLSFIGGVETASFFYPKILSLSLICIFFVLVFIGLTIFWKNKKIILVVSSLGIFMIGFWLVSQKLRIIQKIGESKINFSGPAIIVSNPEIKNNKQKFFVKGIEEKAMQENFFLTTIDYPQFKYGDLVLIECQLNAPKNISKDFDYKMYLAQKGAFWECYFPAKIEAKDKNKGNKIYSFILKIKNNFKKEIKKIMPFPESVLLEGLLIGGSAELPEKIQENFSRSGMTHIVAVSGYNVTIVAEYLMIAGIFLGLWRQKAFWLAVLGIIMFVLLTGFSSSAIRAGIMGILIVWAIKNGRLANSQNAILFAGVLMLAINPLSLFWDVGFQLSFLATLGIILLYPFFEKKMIQKNKFFGISEIFFLTVSAQIFVLPIILLNFGNLSLISPLANILILPFIPLTMFLGFLAIIFSWIFPIIGTLFSWISFLFLRYEVETINFLAGFRYASIKMNLVWQEVAVFYGLLFFALFLARSKMTE